MRVSWFVLKALMAVALYFIEGLFWLGYCLRRLVQLAGDMLKARQSLIGGVLHCPKGHPIETDAGTYQCVTCGFISHTMGSLWLCQNPECQATTDFVGCPTCGLSVRSPYRYGGRP